MSRYCPSSLSARSARSAALGCNWIYKYHCLRNKKDETIEKCLEFSWIQKGKCAVYDSEAKQIDAWPCSITRGVCPQKQYQSQDVMSYSACVPLSYSTKNSTDGKNVNKDSSNNNNNNNADVGSTDQYLVITSVTSLAVIGIVVVVAALMYWHWKRKRNLGKDEENTVPLMETDGYPVHIEEDAENGHLEKEQEHLNYFEYKGEWPKHILETMKKHLQKQCNVLIIGKQGSGKTTLAWTVCKQMHGESFEGQRWFVKVSTSTTHIPYDKAMKLILLLDGRFESAWTTEGTVEKVLDELDEMRNKLPSKQMLTIATISKEAYRRISKYGCIRKLKPVEIIDLDCKTNTLTTAEMTKVLEMYNISVRNVTDAEMTKVLSQEQLQMLYECYNSTWLQRKIYYYPNIGFPLLASLMSLNPQFLGNTYFIRQPIMHFWESIKQLRESPELTDRNKYCTIVYALLNRGYVDASNFDEDLWNDIRNLHGHPDAEIDTNFYVLRKRTASVYEFLHESLLRALFAAYGTQHMRFVIDRCPLQILLEYSLSCREMISRKESMFYLSICGFQYEKALIHRVIDLKVDMRHHRIWEQTDFPAIYHRMHREICQRKK